jgi:hypothetical protein
MSICVHPNEGNRIKHHDTHALEHILRTQSGRGISVDISAWLRVPLSPVLMSRNSDTSNEE